MLPVLLLVGLLAEPAPGPAPRDAPMVAVPAGPFLMGSDARDREALGRERPQRRIVLPAFRIEAYEVTNAAYEQCVKAGACERARQVGGSTRAYYANTDAPEQPVVGVRLADAQAYCAWVGRRLPTELEWEKAARGVDGRRFPWGDEPATCERANFGRCGMVARPPGSLPAAASPYGAHDMAGNVIEWTSTRYRSTLLAELDADDPKPPRGRGWVVIRGGSWGSYGSQVRSAFRRAWDPKNAGHTIGFRCAADPTAPGP